MCNRDITQTMQQTIAAQLGSQLDCKLLEVINESHLHAGHNDFDGTGESHFRIIIAATQLDKLAPVTAHQTIYAILKPQMQLIHALAIEVKKTNLY